MYSNESMRGAKVILFGWFAGVLACCLSSPVAHGWQESPEESQTQKVDFARDIQPIFSKRCHECHGEELAEGDLRTDQRNSVFDEDNYFLTPGNADESLMYKVIISTEDDRMPPPDEGDPLPPEEAALIKSWIDQGAVWPEDATETPVPADNDAAVTKQPAEATPANQPQEPTDKPADAPTDAPADDPPAGKQDPSQTQDQPSSGDENRFGSAGDQPPKQETKPADSDPPAATKPLTPSQEFWVKVWRAFGELHPALAHFPIALLIVGGLAALFSFRGSYACADFAFYCLWLGALSAILAAGLGWSFAWNEGYNEDPFQFDRSERLFWHRWTGVASTILSFLLALVATVSRRRDPENGSLWRLGLIVLAALTIYVGHAGGELTHRRGYGKILELFGMKKAVVQPNDNAPAGRDDAAKDNG